MRKYLSFIIAFALLLASCGKEAPDYTASSELTGISINEICAAVEDGDRSWVEIVNTGGSVVNLHGLKLLVSDDYYYRLEAFQFGDLTLSAGEKHIIGEFSKDYVLKVSNLEEVALASGSDSLLCLVDVKALASKVGKHGNGQSWSRIPDCTGDFVLSEKATPGEKNYKFVARNIKGLIINELSTADGWVELYHSSNGLLNLYETTLVKTDNSGKEHTVYTFGEDATIKSRNYLSVNAELGDLKTLKLVSNEGIVTDEFKVAEVKNSGTPYAGQSYSRLPDITGDWYISSTATRDAANQDSSDDVSELVLNEVCTAESWVEVYNPTVRTLRVDNAVVKVGSTAAATLSGTMKPGEHKVLSVKADGTSAVTLVAPDGKTVDSFRKTDVKDGDNAPSGGSWSRIPDGSDWYTVKTASKGNANYGIIKGNTVGIWYNQSSTPSLSSNLDQFVKLGIGHVFLHEYAFRYYENLIPGILEKAGKLGITIHIWMQCFWWNDNQGVNGWRSPVIDSEKRYDQDMFDDILGDSRAAKYVKAGVQGIHFDYIRFGGTAYKHDFPDAGVTGQGAIDEFCRQAAEKLRAINPDLILSAALMAETGSERYYGQHPESMGKYLDILIPMIYGNSSNKSYGTCKSIANYFAEHGVPAQCWAGVDTYDSGSRGLDAATIKASCDIYKGTKAKGIMLFRHGIGSIPSLLDLKLNGQ